ncbi:uncharacterized protein LY79DRAFT_111469 [Colletotrichum navitas]|uniref:Uncharacterized protein n=1 Tax=Colletotrichum navitas TaxID=681940 RepID=A0AAD8Q3N9_9PEZI|nr:uncharacterized protein LY79DRAFT_111469 [Colletotrichum navitas]KAK1595357.1 hypothetical protein LY79DRAFT_111469 [Colletotrichum navitas]
MHSRQPGVPSWRTTEKKKRKEEKRRKKIRGTISELRRFARHLARDTGLRSRFFQTYPYFTNSPDAAPLAVRGAAPGRACVQGGIPPSSENNVSFYFFVFSSSPGYRGLAGCRISARVSSHQWPVRNTATGRQDGSHQTGSSLSPLSRRLLPLARLRMSIGLRGLSGQTVTQPFALNVSLVVGAARPRRR